MITFNERRVAKPAVHDGDFEPPKKCVGGMDLLSDALAFYGLTV